MPFLSFLDNFASYGLFIYLFIYLFNYLFFQNNVDNFQILAYNPWNEAMPYKNYK